MRGKNIINVNYSINYGTTSEFHKPYYKTNKAIFGRLPAYFISSLSQFTSLTPSEAIFLNKKLLKLKKKILIQVFG